MTSTPENTAYALAVAHATTTALRDAAARLESWSDSIADVDPEAYMRNLLTVLGTLHDLAVRQRREVTVEAIDRGLITQRRAAAALGISPSAVLRWQRVPDQDTQG